MPAWLWALAAAAFVYFTDDYVVAGVLPEIAAEFATTEAVAGQLITVFSLTVAVAAPVAAVVTASWPRRGLLLTASGVFVAANVAAALTPSFPFLMALRVVAALAAAAATPALFAVTAALAPAQRRGRYLGIVSIGVTGSIAAGVPIGTWIGGAFGWRATFAAVAVAGASVSRSPARSGAWCSRRPARAGSPRPPRCSRPRRGWCSGWPRSTHGRPGRRSRRSSPGPGMRPRKGDQVDLGPITLSSRA